MRVLFVCVHNAGRSQMAEAYTNHLAREGGMDVVAESAGTIGGKTLNPTAVEVMAEAGISMTGQAPKLLTPQMADWADRIISMGCGVDAEACPTKFLVTEDWALDDPAGQPIEKVRAIRDEIPGPGGKHAEASAMIKRYIAELAGTFVIVLAPVALASGSHSSGDTGLLAAALVSGFSVLAMIYALGPISAAHFNPAVTLGFAVARRFPWRFVLPYWLAQLAGGILAAATAFVIFGHAAGSHFPAEPSAPLRSVGVESCIGFFLMLVIIAVATDKRVSSTVPGLAIGLTVVFGVLIGGPVSGGSMNPARSFGPALFGPHGLDLYWVYVVGPCLGATVASLLYEAIRLDREFAKGAPNELLEALDQIRSTKK